MPPCSTTTSNSEPSHLLLLRFFALNVNNEIMKITVKVAFIFIWKNVKRVSVVDNGQFLLTLNV